MGFQSGQTHWKWVKLPLKPIFCIFWPSSLQKTFTHTRYHVWLSAGTLWAGFRHFPASRELSEAPTGPDWYWNWRFCGFFIWKSNLHSRYGQCTPNTVKKFQFDQLEKPVGLVLTIFGQPGSSCGPQTLREQFRNTHYCDLVTRKSIWAPVMTQKSNVLYRNFTMNALGLVMTIFGQPRSRQGSQTLSERCWNTHFCNFFTQKINLSPSKSPHTPNTMKEL